ncbi:MAG: acyl carrier protein [Deltaproteobacteria bacterium]|nr:acyl carrier protein [Deltaproteobacteria bacterium]
MEQQLRQIVAQIAETNEDFANDADFREVLGIDSLGALELIFEIEQALGITIPEKQYAEVHNFNDLLRVAKNANA